MKGAARVAIAVVLIASSLGWSEACTQTIGKACCPGSKVGSFCVRSPVVPTQGAYCKATTGVPTGVCTFCGNTPGEPCCPGTKVNSTCSITNAPSGSQLGYCKKVSATGPNRCVACGEPGQVCCPGSKVGGVCADQLGIVGICKLPLVNGLPQCKKCGVKGFQCCPKTAVSTPCIPGLQCKLGVCS